MMCHTTGTADFPRDTACLASLWTGVGVLLQGLIFTFDGAIRERRFHLLACEVLYALILAPESAITDVKFLFTITFTLKSLILVRKFWFECCT